MRTAPRGRDTGAPFLYDSVRISAMDLALCGSAAPRYGGLPPGRALLDSTLRPQRSLTRSIHGQGILNHLLPLGLEARGARRIRPAGRPADSRGRRPLSGARDRRPGVRGGPEPAIRGDRIRQCGAGHRRLREPRISGGVESAGGCRRAGCANPGGCRLSLTLPRQACQEELARCPIT